MTVPPLPPHIRPGSIAPERLTANGALSQQQKLAEASRQFEAILLRQILEASQKPVITSKYSDASTAASVYRDLISCQLADSISQSGALGLARAFEQQLAQKGPPPADLPATTTRSQSSTSS